MKILQARDNRDRLTCDHVERLLGDIVDNIDPSVDVVKPNIINSIVVSTDVPRKLERPVREMITFQEESDQYIVEMYRSSTFMWTWNGTHHGRTVHDTKHVTRDVVYLHYHAVGMQRQIERARTICIGYGYIRDADTDLEILHKLARLGNVCGIHRVKEYMHVVSAEKDHYRRIRPPFWHAPVKRRVYLVHARVVLEQHGNDLLTVTQQMEQDAKHQGSLPRPAFTADNEYERVLYDAQWLQSHPQPAFQVHTCVQEYLRRY